MVPSESKVMPVGFAAEAVIEAASRAGAKKIDTKFFMLVSNWSKLALKCEHLAVLMVFGTEEATKGKCLGKDSTAGIFFW